ncbi:MAG TPA: hypothetical protein VF841_11730 [Anaeromyxobacter sp.]
MMIARLLYTAVALCLLGAWPEHAGSRAARAVETRAPVAAAAAGEAGSSFGPAPVDFAIPPNSR